MAFAIENTCCRLVVSSRVGIICCVAILFGTQSRFNSREAVQI